MPSILNLKFKGNKSFVAFSNLGDTEALTKTWKVCTKVASYLEQGQRLENLSWRLWHLQNLMVDTDNAKSKREFKKLSKFMGDKLDKEKGRSIEELQAPDYKHNHSADVIRQRAAEKERNREASQNAAPGTIKRMQFTFSVDRPSPAVNQHVKKPDYKPSAEFNRRAGNAVRSTGRCEDDMVIDEGNDKDPPLLTMQDIETPTALRFPPLFSSGFGPTALLNSTPTLTTRMSYGEGFHPATAPLHEGFSITRPTIELPLDEILSSVDTSDNILDFWTLQYPEPAPSNIQDDLDDQHHEQHLHQDVQMQAPVTTTPIHAYTIPMPAPPPAATVSPIAVSPPPAATTTSHKRKAASISIAPPRAFPDSSDESSTNTDSDSEDSDFAISRRPTAPAPAPTSITTRRRGNSTVVPGGFASSPAASSAGVRKGRRRSSTSAAAKGPLLSQSVRELLADTVQPSRVNLLYDTRSSSNTPVAGTRPTLTLKTGAATRAPGHGATAMSLTSAAGLKNLNGNSSGPGGVKAECSNCGATHTPLWRRGLNDELNCNACGLYCKLHKRPRPKSMRNSHGERTQAPTPRQQHQHQQQQQQQESGGDALGLSSPVPKPPPRSSSPVNRIAQCYNCHTTATPLWRKDDEGKTVCNACGLYYKLHGSARPISMKSDVIRKRSRHEARRGGASETPSASPGVSRRPSPAPSPTLAPDSSTQMTPDAATQMAFTDYSEELDFRQSELLGALGDLTQSGLFGLHPHFPGPYHPDYLSHMYAIVPQADALPFTAVGSLSDSGSSSGDVGNGNGNLNGNGNGSGNLNGNEVELPMSPRSTKRRRMSTDSASEPPSSATSYSSYATDGGYTTSATSVSMEFPFSSYGSSASSSGGSPGSCAGGGYVIGPALRGSGNTFWHPPMMPQVEGSPQLFHPPMLPPAEDCPMDYLQAPGGRGRASSQSSSGVPSRNNNNHINKEGGGGGGGGHHADETELLFSSFLHPPMAIPEDLCGGGGVVYGGGVHPPMMVDYQDIYESAMRAY